MYLEAALWQRNGSLRARGKVTVSSATSSDTMDPVGDGGKDDNLLLFLLLGQSNMEGAPAPEPQDLVQNPRIKVLAYDNCSAVGRTYNQWYDASPPLHSSVSGVGPGDYFARTLLASLPARYRVGLVPCAINGVDIDFFRKGVVSRRRDEFRIPPDNHWPGAYDWVVLRAKLAQETGRIRGILFHQGESDSGDVSWGSKVQGLVDDLRKDLALGEVPVLVGELYRDGACSGHNALVAELPRRISNCTVVSAQGLTGQDQFHFDLVSQRELGVRMGHAMLNVLQIP